jgi:5'-phosphate synthase pdxT subunit
LSRLIGILAVQGAYHKHQEIVQKLGYSTILVKTVETLNQVDSLIMPGGESTAMILILKKHLLWEPLQNFCKNKPVFGTCAGAILLAKNTEHNAVDTLNIMDITISRNSYGRQIDSFETEVEFNKNKIIPAVFIRAPKIIKYNQDNIRVLAYHNKHPVIVQQGNKMACTFHPELTADNCVHEYFLNLN